MEDFLYWLPYLLGFIIALIPYALVAVLLIALIRWLWRKGSKE